MSNLALICYFRTSSHQVTWPSWVLEWTMMLCCLLPRSSRWPRAVLPLKLPNTAEVSLGRYLVTIYSMGILKYSIDNIIRCHIIQRLVWEEYIWNTFDMWMVKVWVILIDQTVLRLYYKQELFAICTQVFPSKLYLKFLKFLHFFVALGGK